MTTTINPAIYLIINEKKRFQDKDIKWTLRVKSFIQF